MNIDYLTFDGELYIADAKYRLGFPGLVLLFFFCLLGLVPDQHPFRKRIRKILLSQVESLKCPCRK